MKGSSKIMIYQVIFLLFLNAMNFFKAILLSVPIQLLAYHIAVFKGTDVDQPKKFSKISNCGVGEKGEYFSKYKYYLCFNITIRTNKLVHIKTLYFKQQKTFRLIKNLHNKVWDIEKYRII